MGKKKIISYEVLLYAPLQSHPTPPHSLLFNSKPITVFFLYTS